MLPFHIQSRRSEVEGGPFRVQDGVFIFSGAHRVEGMSLPAQPYLTLLPAAFKPRGLGCEFPPQDPGMCGIPGSPLFGEEEIPPGCLPNLSAFARPSLWSLSPLRSLTRCVSPTGPSLSLGNHPLPPHGTQIYRQDTKWTECPPGQQNQFNEYASSACHFILSGSHVLLGKRKE